MKKTILVVLTIIIMSVLVGCGSKVNVDFENASDFETALNTGEDLSGKVVNLPLLKWYQTAPLDTISKPASI